jgi:RNA polymerase sigma-70 factor (ECF subfamily)
MMTFAQLYETYFQDVYRFALWLSRNDGEAEDLTSETFIRAWSRRRKLRTETLKGYLFAITRNAFLDSRRKRNATEQLPEELLDDSPGPRRQAAARIDLDQVRRVMQQLPEHERLALVLRAEQGLSYAEIARVLEVPMGTARVNVHRARRRLIDFYLSQHGGK